MALHPHGFEGLVQAIANTRDLVTRVKGPSLVDAVFEEQDGDAIRNALRVWLCTPLADFVNGYAAELTASIDSLVLSGNLDEADIAAAEALFELAEQLRFVDENQDRAEVTHDQVVADPEMAWAA